jgi:hypothetical protein
MFWNCGGSPHWQGQCCVQRNLSPRVWCLRFGEARAEEAADPPNHPVLQRFGSERTSVWAQASVWGLAVVAMASAGALIRHYACENLPFPLTV